METKPNFTFKVAAIIGIWLLSLIPNVILLVFSTNYANCNPNFLNSGELSFENFITQTNAYTMVYTLFTFIALLISEWYYKKRIHPIQYILILIAMLLFNVLFIAFGEFLKQFFAYWIAAIMTISLINIYSTGFFKNNKFPIKSGVYLSVLYFFMFIMISLPDAALLVGSLSFFVLLALVMYFTRDFDFYSSRKSLQSIDIPNIPVYCKDKDDLL